MQRHWQDSKPFNYLRKKFGIQKPYALEWGKWDEWKEKTRAEHPVGYWMTEKLPDYLEKIPEYTIDWYYDLKYYWRNRFYRQTHVLPTKLEVGQYYDLDTRILHGLMEALVDYVEVEKAWMNRWDKDGKPKYKMKRGRSALSGLAYIQWEMELVYDEDMGVQKGDALYGKPTEQALQASEVLKLYNWWKFERPARPDPYDASGWTAYCNKGREEYGTDIWIFRSDRDTNPKLKKMGDIAHKKLHKIEAQYEKEDEEMLLRLIKIRKGLWT